MDQLWIFLGRVFVSILALVVITRLIVGPRKDKPTQRELTPDQKTWKEAQVVKAKAGQQVYDALVVTLSGGALGVSFAFLKDVANGRAHLHTEFLLGAWTCWGASLACILASHYTGIEGIRKAIRQMTTGRTQDRPGGVMDLITGVLNPMAGAGFIVGLICMIAFVYVNPYADTGATAGSNTTRTQTETLPVADASASGQRLLAQPSPHSPPVPPVPIPGPRPDPWP